MSVDVRPAIYALVFVYLCVVFGGAIAVGVLIWRALS